MGAFLKIILYAVLIFYAFNMLIKLIFRRKMRKLEKQMNQFGQEEAKTDSNEEKKPHVDPNIGEYTDYEEIK
ncbi:MAG: hypothetical protein Q4F82_10015 [bacterium]|jgi:hypothetical protein|nr:MAG: hypothetical protein AUK64_1024 [bacterium P201]KWW40809.1 MAG: hypothetical protein F083_1343 [bacterium F083]MDO5316422.1 hypothetical protein [bacterium]